jgi:hypothetical protein
MVRFEAKPSLEMVRCEAKPSLEPRTDAGAEMKSRTRFHVV